MFYKNTIKNKNQKYKLYTFETFQGGINADLDENVIPFNQSKNSYNFSYKNGALTEGMGLREVVINYSITNPSLTKTLAVPEGVSLLGLWTQNTYFSQLPSKDRLLLTYGSDGQMYYNYLHYNDDVLHTFAKMVTLDEVPQVLHYYINGQRVYMFVTKSGGLQVYYHNKWVLETIADAPSISSFCLHNDRMFVTDYNHENRVWFSDESDPTNWTLGNDQAGYIEFHDERGNCLKVVDFDDYVYVIREFGISRISSFTKQTSINTENMFLSGSRILKDTICVCGNRILFMTTDGLYSFNGNSVSKVSLNIDNFLKQINKYSLAQFYKNSYYLACKIDFNDAKKLGCENYVYENNAIVKFDLSTNEVSILRGIDVKFLNVLNDVSINELVVVIKENNEYKIGFLDNNGKIFNEKLEKYWKSSPYDFDMPNKKKLVKKFYVNSDVEAVITFNYDGKTKSFEISGSEERISISPNISGYKIGVEITTLSDVCNISSPQILVGYL